MVVDRDEMKLLDGDRVELLPVGWGHVIQVWWALAWRSVAGLICAAAVAVPVGFAISLGFGGLARAFGRPMDSTVEAARMLAGVQTLVIFLCSSGIVLRRVLRKQFRGFRVVLLRTN